MKLLAMHKVDESMETGAPPPKQVIEGMGALLGELMQKGMFLGGEGLKASATRARVRFARGERQLEKGPYRGRHELIAGLCLLRAETFDEAVGWGGRIAEALGEGSEVEVGPVNEPWDLGAPAPSPLPPARYLALAKSDAKSESGDAFLSRIKGAVDEMKRAGVLITAEGLAPSSKAKRFTLERNRRKIVDGPFTESKELIAGYAVLQVGSWDEVLDISERFAKVLGGTVEMDLRPIA